MNTTSVGVEGPNLQADDANTFDKAEYLCLRDEDELVGKSKLHFRQQLPIYAGRVRDGWGTASSLPTYGFGR